MRAIKEGNVRTLIGGEVLTEALPNGHVGRSSAERNLEMEQRENPNDWLYSLFVKSFLSTSRRSFVFLALSFCVRICAWGQDSTLTIRVESHQVLVPISWLGLLDCFRQTCSWDGETVTAPNQKPEDLDPFDLGFISVTRLRLFEDGKEQKIQKVERISSGDNGVRTDNLGTHSESASVPEGIWSTSDQNSSLFKFVSGNDYVIAYTPPPSPEGSCHRIHIKAPKHGSQLIYRREYCNVQHSTSDTLRGTSDGNALEQHIALGEPGKIHTTAAGSYFYTARGQARVRVEVEFPFDEVKPSKWSDGSLPYSLLIIAYGKDRSVVERRSDQREEDPNFPFNDRWYNLERAAAIFTQTRYEAQMELPPGEYRLAIAVSHGPKFGITEVPLRIDDYDGKELGISSIALCKRVRKAEDKPVASEFVPLVSNGYEFTPAANTRFHKSDSVMVYFELYEPLLNVPQPEPVAVKFEMRIADANTGAVLTKIELSAAPWIQQGKSTIPIAVKPMLDKLAPGRYTLEVQASDSAGRSTPLRTAELSIE